MNIYTVNKVDNQRNIVSLINDDEFSVEVRYEPLQHSLRVLHGGVQRLFFYEQDDFFPSRATLLNEYGLVVGKLQLRNSTKGTLQIFESRISFTNDPAQKTMLVHHPAAPEGLQWNYASLQHTAALDKPDELLRALLMILTWSVSVSTLQV